MREREKEKRVHYHTYLEEFLLLIPHVLFLKINIQIVSRAT